MPENTPTLVSVIIPAHNYANYLPDCVNSVLTQVGDAHRSEIIVVDDSSTDDTPEVAKQLGDKIIYLRQENRCASATRNTGIRMASGKYMIFLDADDLLAPGTIAAHLENFATRPELDISICPCLYFYPPDSGQTSMIWPLMVAELDLHLCHSLVSPIHAFMLKREIAGQTFFFEPDMRTCEDNEYWLRCAAAGANFATTTSGLALYRWHSKSLSQNIPQQERDAAILRQKKIACLEQVAGFPRAGKFLGWLAFAAGMVRHADFSKGNNANKTRESLAAASFALLKSRRHYGQAPFDTAYRCQSGNYYAASILCARNLFRQFGISGSDIGLGFLESCFPELAKLPADELAERKKSLYGQLPCDNAAIMATLRREMARDSFLARILQ